MKNHPNYEFIVFPDGAGWYQYIIRIADLRKNVAGGICRGRKAAEQEARTRIADLTRGRVS
jgi:hypothetical protein